MALSSLFREVFGVQQMRFKLLKPEGLYRLFGLPAWRFGMPVGMPEIIGADTMRCLEEELLEDTAPLEKIRRLEKFLLRLAQFPRMPSVVGDFLETVHTEPLRKGRIKAYVRDTGRTPKQFIQAFKNAVGHTPQTYLQLVQVNKSVAMIANCPGLSLTEVAYEQGFYEWENGVLKTTDGGVSWNSVYPKGGKINVVKFFNATTGYYKSDKIIYKTTDGGQTWTTSARFISDDYFIGISFVGGATGWACTFKGLVLRIDHP